MPGCSAATATSTVGPRAMVFRVRTTRGSSSTCWPELAPGRGSVVGRVALEGRPVQIVDVLADLDYTQTEARRIADYRSLLGAPLLREGVPIGVIALQRKEERPFTDKQIELAATFADQAVIAIENVRLFEAEQQRTRELQESLEYQTATAEVLNVISRSPAELQPVLDSIVRTAARLCSAEYAFIVKYDGSKCHLVAANEVQAEHIKYIANNPVALERGTVTGRVALDRRTIHVPDVLADPEFTQVEWQKVGKQRTVLGVPLLREGALIGVIILARTEVAPFREKQVELVTTFADQAVIAIENVRLFDEVKARTEELSESLQQQTATADVLKIISRSTFDLKSVLQTLVESRGPPVRCRQGDDHPAEGRRILSCRGLWLLCRVRGLRQGRPGRAGARIGHRTRIARGQNYPYSRRHRRSGLHLCRGSEARRFPHHSRRADAARGAADRRSCADALRGATIHRAGDRSRLHVRRPGGDRHRERAPVRRDPGQEPPAGDGEPAQVAVRRQHEPRAAHAAQRHHRPHRDDVHQRGALRHREGGRAAAPRAPRRHPPARPDQPGARPVQDRSRQARAQSRAGESCSARRRRGRHRAPARRAEQEPAGRRGAGQPRLAPGRSHAAAADPAQPAQQRLQVHQGRRGRAARPQGRRTAAAGSSSPFPTPASA